MPSSVFTRPRARPALAAISSQQNLISVATEDEFFAALTTLPRSDGACYGRGINIVADIGFTKTIVLASQHSGLRITSSSSSRVFSPVLLGNLFLVDDAINVTIENLTVGRIGDPGNGFVVLVGTAGKNLTIRNIFVESTSDLTHVVLYAPFGLTSYSGIGLKVLNCVVDDDTGSKSVSLYCQVTDTVCTGAQFIGNVNFFGGIGTPPTPGFIFFRGCLDKSVISQNVNLGKIDMSFTAASTLNCTAITSNIMRGQIIIGAATQDFVISSNAMNGNDIYTLNGANNSIVANTQVGTITNSGTDAVTSNT